ncbi:MAG: molybdenum cofactor biosynthesis protein [Candidatus Hydrogenedentota bacterium]|nr:MAG: molybdenum cofactor biosynthesis protein [Candidatus Hydrogenedentota bacterium]
MSLKDQAYLAEHFTKKNPLRVQIITMSDRAASGEYEDKSGPQVSEHLLAFLGGAHIAHDINTLILPDDPDGLRETLLKAKDDELHLIFTTGGTGVGPRDNTPDVVIDVSDKIIPGVMEHIRLKYGADKPCALLSRTVAAVMASTLIYTIPGSTKGVDEYMTELLKTMDHTLCVIHSLEKHE